MLARGKISVPSTTSGWSRLSSSRPSHDLGLCGVDTLEQDCELVAAQPRDGIGVTHGLLEASRDADEQLVAGRVAEAVVDGLEVVDVDEEHGDTKERPA